MKKILVIVIVSLISFALNAQINPHAIGLRLGGDGDVNGAEISYQQALGSVNRLELDLGFGSGVGHSRMFLAGIYQWDWNLTKGLNWYVGPGTALGFYSYDGEKDYLNIGVGGQIGLEYDFNTAGAPILLSIDARPLFDLLGDHSGFGWGAALGIRYTW